MSSLSHGKQPPKKMRSVCCYQLSDSQGRYIILICELNHSLDTLVNLQYMLQILAKKDFLSQEK